MDDPLFVRRFQGIGDLPGDRKGIGRGERATRDERGQVVALDELHDEDNAAVGVGIVQWRWGPTPSAN